MPLSATGSWNHAAYDTDTGDADQDIDALIAGPKWTAGTVTCSFPDSSGDYGYGTERNNNFGQLTAEGQDVMRMAFAAVSGFTALDFEELGDDAGEDDSQAVIKVGQTDATSTGWAYYPSGTESGGDIWLRNTPPGWDTDGFDTPRMGKWGWFTFWHELGHALGLKHGHETSGPGAMTAAHDAMEYSVMTYRSHPGAGTGGYTNESYGYAQSFMMYDIAALQRLYGADYACNAGDTVYSFSPTTGEMFVDGVGLGIPGANRIFRTIWDGNGADSYDLSNYTSDLNIDLAPGGFSDFSAGSTAQNARLASGVWAQGHVYNALLHAGDRRSLIENAIGGSGNDVIRGNDAANRLQGGEGADTLYGGGFHDSLEGDDGDDFLFGGGGDDTLTDGAGTDRIWGANGVDRFVFVRDGAADMIRHYEAGEVIDLSGWGLSGMADIRLKEVGGAVVIVERGGGEWLHVSSRFASFTAADFDGSVLVFA